MEHICDAIQGWFSYKNLYKEIVNKFDSGSKLVEIGTWKGKSASYMAVEIANSNKNIEFYCVDTWQGSAEHVRELHGDASIINNTLYEDFLLNIKPVSHIINPIRSTSIEAAATFEDNSLDFIFIDAAHDYENVKNDLNAWYPKLKPSGIFAGHDYIPNWPGVIQAVNEFCSINRLIIQSQELCWVVRDNKLK